MTAVGFACFGMNLVGVGEDGKPCTPVFTYAASSTSSPPHRSAPTPSLAAGGSPGGAPPGLPAGCSVEDDVMERLRESLERTGVGGEGGLEEARRRTGAPTHVSYAPAQLLRWLRAVTTAAPASAATTATKEGQGEGEGGGGGEGSPQRQERRQQRQQQRRRVRVWQTLPSLIAAKWCRLASAPVSYSEASWMGLLDFRRLEVRGCTCTCDTRG